MVHMRADIKAFNVAYAHDLQHHFMHQDLSKMGTGDIQGTLQCVFASTAGTLEEILFQDRILRNNT